MPFSSPIILTALFAALASGQTWMQLNPNGSPPAPRSLHSAVLDPANRTMIIFGGAGYSGLLNDTWRLTNADGHGTPAWLQVSTASPAPSGRTEHTAVFDPAINGMIVYGGSTGSGSCLNDLYVLTNPGGSTGDPTDWQTIATAGPTPPGRYAHSAVFDLARRRMVVFGGVCNGVLQNDVWVLDMAAATPTWSQINPLGPTPSPVRWPGSVYDPVSDRMLVYRGLGSSIDTDVWVLTNPTGAGAGTPTWSHSTAGGNAPYRGAVLYDAGSDRMTLVESNLGHTAVLGSTRTNPTWWDITSNPQAAFQTDFSMVYTASSKTLTIFGGWSNYILNNVLVLSHALGFETTLTTNPPGLQVSADGTLATSPKSYIWGQGQGHTIYAPSPQTLQGTDYGFVGWSDGFPQSHIVGGADVTLTATFASRVPITVSANIPNATLIVDGTSYSAPQVFQWFPGSYHTVNVVAGAAPQGSRYVFAAWSDGLPQSHVLAISYPPATYTYTALFTTQHLLTLTTTPPAGGTISAQPGSTDGYYDSGTTIRLKGTPNPGFVFAGFSPYPSGQFTISAPTTVNAMFHAFTTIRVNAGGGLYVDPQGNAWSSDTGYTNGSPFATSNAIGGTTTPLLYQSERWSTGPLVYQFAVPDGQYSVRLKFAEIYFVEPGRRVFNVSVNNVAIAQNFDVIGSAGAANTATDLVSAVTVQGSGMIRIELSPVVSNPKISAIEIVPQRVDLTLSPAVATVGPNESIVLTPAMAGGTSSQLTWSMNPPLGILSNGQYTAPVFLTTWQTVTVTAASVEDPSRTASTRILLTPGWQSQDVGAVNAPGSFSYAKGTYTLTGSGDIYGGSDAFRYAWQSMTGDGAIVARVNLGTCCVNPDKAGLMIRDSLNPGAPAVFLGVYSGIVGLFHSRVAASVPQATQFGASGVFWLRLVRSGNLFTGYLSNDGAAWMPCGSAPVPMSGTVLAGLAVSSGYGAPVKAMFDGVTFTTPVAVSIDQTLVSLAAAQQAQFTASGGPVTWSIAPALGTMGPDGLYMAPAMLSTPQTVTVTATSVADPNSSASVVARLGWFTPVRVNAGGPSHVDPTGVFWNGDTGCSKGLTFSSGVPIANTLTPYLYQTERFHTGAFDCQYIVPNGTYQVKLKFAEIYFTQAGKRVFHVVINGIPQLFGFDIVADAGGPGRATDKSFVVPVTNGRITIEFNPVVSNPKISAIEIQ